MVAIFEYLQDLAGEDLDTAVVEAVGQISRTENQLSHWVCHAINQADTPVESTGFCKAPSSVSEFSIASWSSVEIHFS